MRVIIAGSRTIKDYKIIEDAVDKIIRNGTCKCVW